MFPRDMMQTKWPLVATLDIICCLGYDRSLAGLYVHELLEEYLVVLVDHVLPLILLQVMNESLVIIQLMAVLNCQFRLLPGAPSRYLLQPLLVSVQVSMES
jgi:hypothetical protein